jgi:hypothetical protein
MATYKWEEKIPNILSSGSRPRFDSFIRGTRQVAVESTLKEQQLDLLSQERKDQIEGKKKARKWFHRLGGLTIEEALRLEAIDSLKKADNDAKKQDRVINKIWRDERDTEYRKGVEAREAERVRKRTLKAKLLNGEVIEEGDPILVPIPDTKDIWWSNQPLERQVLRKRKRGVPCLIIPSHTSVIQGDNDTTIITDTNGDASLLDDVMLFPDPGESGSELQSTSNSDDFSDESGEESP